MAALKLPSTVFPQKTSSQNNREHFTQQGTPLQNRENFCSNGSYLHNREHIYTTGKKLTQPQWRSVNGRSQFHDRENSYVLLSSQGELPNTWALFEIKMQWIVSSLPRTRNRQESGDIPEQNGTAEACWALNPEVAGLKPFSCFHILTHSHQIKHSAAAQFSQPPGRKQIVITEVISLVILPLCLSWLDSLFSQKLGINSCIDWDCSWRPRLLSLAPRLRCDSFGQITTSELSPLMTPRNIWDCVPCFNFTSNVRITSLTHCSNIKVCKNILSMRTGSIPKI